jgi:hypothetical protein
VLGSVVAVNCTIVCVVLCLQSLVVWGAFAGTFEWFLHTSWGFTDLAVAAL